jgi:hypothetical protein
MESHYENLARPLTASEVLDHVHLMINRIKSVNVAGDVDPINKFHATATLQGQETALTMLMLWIYEEIEKRKNP